MACVCHHVHYTWHHIHPLRQQPLVFMASHSLYWWHHMHYIWHVIYCVWYHIHYKCDITQCLYLWHHTLYDYDISTSYGITDNVMTTQPLCNFTATMSDFTPTVSTSQPLCVWHPMHCMWHHIHNLGHHTTLCMRSGPHYLTSLPLYLCHNNHRLMTSHPLYIWPHIQYICNITSTIFVT